MAAPSTLTNPTLTSSVHDPLPPAASNYNPSGALGESAAESKDTGAGGAISEETSNQPAINATPISPIERRNSLEKHLQSRPEAKDLRERGILLGSEGQSPAILAKARELERARAADQLKKELAARPEAQDLRERNILHGTDGQSPAIQAKTRELERARAADTLKKELGARPAKDELVARNILPDSQAAPGIQAQQKELQKHMRMNSLEQKLAQRPTADTLVKDGILEEDGEGDELAVQE